MNCEVRRAKSEVLIKNRSDKSFPDIILGNEEKLPGFREKYFRRNNLDF